MTLNVRGWVKKSDAIETYQDRTNAKIGIQNKA